ncbi:defensin, isoforms B and C-like [Crassostrea virginica]
MSNFLILLLGFSLVFSGTDAAAAERHKRLTCQLGTISIGGNSIGNFGCYLHCKGHGYNGGYCNSQSVITCTR